MAFAVTLALTGSALHMVTSERKRYERAAGALLLDRGGTQWVPVSAASVQDVGPVMVISKSDPRDPFLVYTHRG